MDPSRLGPVIRALRIKKAYRQADLATRAGVARGDVSKLEMGRARELRLDVLVRIVEALGGRLEMIVRWQGGELDRLLNARHAAMHESVARHLLALSGWELAPEVSFSIRGERGVIDILAWHAATRTLVVIELKTEIVDISELMGVVDQKGRLAADIARERGWLARSVSVWVVVAEGATNRRRVGRHLTTLRAAFPADGRRVRAWLGNPDGSIAGLTFWSDAASAGTNAGFATVKRVRRPRHLAA